MRRTKIVTTPSGQVLIERFSLARRIEHWVATAVFVLLVLTGFPQKFDSAGPGHWILGLLGGLDNTRLIHRITGVIFAAHAFLHLAIALVGVLTRRMRPALVPVPQDLRDAWQNLRFYFGKRAHPPPLPKFDYKQKFEYMGLILGSVVMISSGFVLLFPVEIAKYLPSWAIPAFAVAHSSEAMLALLVLVVWHLYGAVLSPDVFPLDRSIIDGYITAEELKHHHRAEYDLLFPDGDPAERPAAPEALVSIGQRARREPEQAAPHGPPPLPPRVRP